MRRICRPYLFKSFLRRQKGLQRGPYLVHCNFLNGAGGNQVGNAPGSNGGIARPVAENGGHGHPGIGTHMCRPRIIAYTSQGTQSHLGNIHQGRLAQKTLDMFEQIGITCEEMRDKDTRKLIFVNEDLKLRFFLAKGPDVPTYVEYGAADIGVTGKDIILEEGRKLYEVMDLGFGKCRMCVCGPESARELLQNNQLIRVATKYPNIAKDYFYNKKHQTVEIIKLNGSIELAPIVGLSEVIVDIVETGSTLRENGLNVLEEVCPLSARMVVNQVSMKMEDERIRNLIRNLRNVISK